MKIIKTSDIFQKITKVSKVRSATLNTLCSYQLTRCELHEILIYLTAFVRDIYRDDFKGANINEKYLYEALKNAKNRRVGDEN